MNVSFLSRVRTAPAPRAAATFAFLAAATIGLFYASSPVPRQTAPVQSHARPGLALLVSTPAPPSVFAAELAMSPGDLMARWDPLIARASRRFAIPAPWIRAVMRMESGGRTMLAESQPITSSAGAMGIMQVMPQTYAQMRAQYRLGADPYDPHDNVIAGAAYLRWLYGKYGYPAMFAAYNDGPGMFEDRRGKGQALPAETRAYVKGIASLLGDSRHGAEGIAHLTRPDGSAVGIVVAAVESVRPPLPGEYPPDVQAIVSAGKLHQGVREDVATATALIRERGGRV